MEGKLMGRRISETKATCRACGHTYFYGKKDELDNCLNATQNCGADMEGVGKGGLCCSGCLPAAFLPETQRMKVIDYDKCPKCGSRAVRKEKIVHDV